MARESAGTGEVLLVLRNYGETRYYWSPATLAKGLLGWADRGATVEVFRRDGAPAGDIAVVVKRALAFQWGDPVEGDPVADRDAMVAEVVTRVAAAIAAPPSPTGEGDPR